MQKHLFYDPDASIGEFNYSNIEVLFEVNSNVVLVFEIAILYLYYENPSFRIILRRKSQTVG